MDKSIKTAKIITQKTMKHIIQNSTHKTFNTFQLAGLKTLSELFQAWCPSFRPTNSIETLKDDSVSDYGQHAATTWHLTFDQAAIMGQKHCDSCIGCLIL